KGLASESDDRGIKIYRVFSLRRAIDRSGIFEMGSFALSGSVSIRGVIQKNQIDAAIVFFSLPSGPIGLLGRRMCGIPYLGSLRGGDVPGAERSLDLIHRVLRP